MTKDEKRPYDVISCTSAVALSASALAAGYLVFKDAGYLTHAKSLYTAANGTRNNKDQDNGNGWLLLCCIEYLC